MVGRLSSAPVEPELKQPPVSKKTEPVKPQKLDLQTFANVVTVGVFNSIAIATAHEHWLKTHEEVLDFTVPLVAWASQLPPKTIKRIENNLAPVATIVGLYSILAPDIALEIKIRNEDRRRIAEEKGNTGQGVNRSPMRRPILDRSRGVQQGSAARQSSTIPNDFAHSQVDDNYNV